MDSAHYTLHAEIEDYHWWFTARRKIVTDIVRAAAPPGPYSRIVDFGCGTGANVAALAEDYDVAGYDTSELAVTLAQERFPRCHFAVASDPEACAASIAVADLVLMLDVLEHVNDDKGLLTRLIGLMQPSARLLVTVPAKMSLWGPQDVAVGHRRRYERASLQSVWDDLPVTTDLLSYYNARLYPVVYIVRGLGRALDRAYGVAGSDFRMPASWLNLLLAGIFASESRRLVDVVSGRRAGGFATGVSLIALLSKASAHSI